MQSERDIFRLTQKVMALNKAASLLTMLESENKLPFMVMVVFKNVLRVFMLEGTKIAPSYLSAAYNNAARCGETVIVKQIFVLVRIN